MPVYPKASFENISSVKQSEIHVGKENHSKVHRLERVNSNLEWGLEKIQHSNTRETIHYDAVILIH